MAGPRNRMMPGEKAKDFKGTMGKLLTYLKKFLPSIVLVLVCAAASTVFSIFGPKVLGQATTKLFEGLIAMLTGTGSIDFAAIGQVLLFLACLYLISALLSYVQGWIMAGVATSLSYSMRKDISEKIDRMPLAYFDRVPNGEVLSRITNDVDTITQTLNQSLSQIVTNVTMMIGVLCMMLSISPLMTLVALCILPLSVLIVTRVVKLSQPFFRRQQEYLGHVNGHVEEMYGGHVIVTAFNGQEKSIETFDELNENLYHAAWKSQFFSGVMQPLMNFVSNLGYVAICVLGGFLTLNGSITVGDIQAFTQYVRNFTQPINQIANISNVLQMTAAAAERVFAFLEEDEEPADPQPSVPAEQIDGSVYFAHVHFGYVPEKTIINDFSAIIKPGTQVAIVGPTGAGKTTIINLLMRFYDPQKGHILMEGRDSMDITRRSLRAAYTMVLQDTWLFYGTIYDNIAFSRPGATREEVIAAAKAAKIHNFIMGLPDGYDTIVSDDGLNISQGQKQMLTIARAMLSDAKMLILDEATSNVDTRTEQQIQEAMRALMKDRTCFVIAHRLSTVQNADTILVVQHGDIIEQGSHDELMQKGGVYAGLYTSQFN